MRRAAALLAVCGSAAAVLTGFAFAAAEAEASTAPLPLPSAESLGSVSSADGLRVVQGATVPTEYGPMQVAIAVRGKRLVRVWALKVTNRYGRSVRASAAAVPVLERRSLEAGSADVDVVTGATYTSEGYKRSLQSALDRIE